MSSHHNTTLNFSHSPYNNSPSLIDIDLKIKSGELRLRYVKLLRDIYTYLNEEEAKELINEADAIWEKLSQQKFNSKT